MYLRLKQLPVAVLLVAGYAHGAASSAQTLRLNEASFADICFKAKSRCEATHGYTIRTDEVPCGQGIQDARIEDIQRGLGGGFY